MNEPTITELAAIQIHLERLGIGLTIADQEVKTWLVGELETLQILIAQQIRILQGEE